MNFNIFFILIINDKILKFAFYCNPSHKRDGPRELGGKISAGKNAPTQTWRKIFMTTILLPAVPHAQVGTGYEPF